jgi:uncharacterized protein YqgV (UPF0045/DUF77 family)
MQTQILHKELKLETQGTQFNTQTMKTLVESIEWEFRMQLVEVKAEAECGDCGNITTGAYRISNKHRVSVN